MPSTTPIPQDQDWFPLRQWLARHEQNLARLGEGPIDLLFLGDSITEGWLVDGKHAWDHHFAKYRVANFGISGDETAHLLWRLDHGEIDQISPLLIVLLIGTNNLGNSGQTADEAIAGIRAVVALLRERLPMSPILLHALFPREVNPGTPFRTAISQINAAIKALADGVMVHWVDLTDTFLTADGALPAKVMPDALHLSPAAYDAWAAVLAPKVSAIIGW